VSESTNFKWYVLRAISGKEAKAKEYIEIDMCHPGFREFVRQVLIPTEKVFQVRNGKKITKERNCMPGYLLVEANLTSEVAYRLRGTPNILGFLEEKDHKPIPVRPAEINKILGSVDEIQETGEEILTPFFVGDNVKVVFGPFSGFNGIIEEVNTEKKKLKVMVMIFGRKNPIELSFTQVEKE
jgi:transcription termination/antitermination factor NusG